ncbi:MAG: hypothetical protein ACP5M0_10590 [Desulfomonilaceae bacterium]
MNVIRCLWIALVLATYALASVRAYAGQEQLEQAPQKLLKAGLGLVEKKHYLEALDHLNEARDALESSGQTESPLYAEVMLSLAETKIRARIYQQFPAYYVKTALEDVQLANKLHERLPGVMPEKLAEGYFLEGYIQKNFFMRYDAAAQVFAKAITVDPSLTAAKRELSELLAEGKQK